MNYLYFLDGIEDSLTNHLGFLVYLNYLLILFVYFANNRLFLVRYFDMMYANVNSMSLCVYVFKPLTYLFIFLSA